MSSNVIDIGPINPRISPLIKLSRWTLLIGGIYWGHKRYNIHKAVEDDRRAYEARMKPIWDAEKAKEKAKASREEMVHLARQIGQKVPDNF